jgi:aldehyde dehydrogenase (NAD+)
MNPTADLFNAAVAFAPQAGSTTLAQRRAALARLKKSVLAHRDAFHLALRSDLGRPEAETDLSELYAVTSLVDYVSGHLARWMRTERVPSPLTLWPARSEIRYESKGAVLVMAPWNFPVNLSLSPVVYAIAAGNAVVLKPSEVAPASAQVLSDVVRDAFPEGWVRMALGDADIAKSLLEHPWNHIFFTGGPAIGKHVMAAASKHLTSVTLELGGKSPVFLDENFDMVRAGKLLAWAKTMNAGQICIAPDYVLVPREKMGDLIHAFAHALKAMYGEQLAANPDYTRIINARHFERLMAWHTDAQNACAQMWQPEAPQADRLFFPPTLYVDPDPSCRISCEEIFGPLLPLIPYDRLEDALAYVNAKERPLVTYVLSENRKFQERTLSETRAGATVINDFIIHYMHHDLPFGGVNHSGIGKSHGIWGFREFTNARPVVRRRWGLNPTLYLAPPYTGWKKKAAAFLLRWM